MLSEIMKELIKGEVVILEKVEGVVYKELLIDDDGKFMTNVLKHPNTKDPYEQDLITDAEALNLLKDKIFRS